MTTITVLGCLAALLYLTSGSLLGVRLARVGMIAEQRTLLLLAALAASLLHAVVLAQTVWLPDGFNLSFFNALSLTGWLIAVVLLLAVTLRPVESLGIILLPFSALSLLLALLFPGMRLVSGGGQWPLELHIFSSILAYSLFALAAVQALLLAVQDYQLRHRHPNGFIRGLPPLVSMEKLLFQLIIIGFLLLSLALLSGLLFLEDVFAQHLIHKTTLSIIAWLVFGTLLWGRWRFGWRGQLAIRSALGGFFALMLAYWGSKLVLELILQRV